MRMLLGDEPVQIKGSRVRPVLQNLGPGNVYIDTSGAVDADSGFRLMPGSVYEFPTSGANSKGIWVMADSANTDLRIVSMG